MTDTKFVLHFLVREGEEPSNPYSSEGDFDEYDHYYHPLSLTRKAPSPELPRTSRWWFTTEAHHVPEEVYRLPSVYAVIVRYTDGGTFQTTSGNGCLWKICATEAEAKAEAERIRNEPRDAPSSIYQPWTGFFCSLDSVEVRCFSIGDNPARARLPA